MSKENALDLYGRKSIEESQTHSVSAKRVSIVSLRMVKEHSLSYGKRVIRHPYDVMELFREFVGDVDREYVVVICLDTKAQPTNISVCHIGDLNSSVAHPREIFKTAILSNAASITVAHCHPSGIAKESQADIALSWTF